MKFGRAFRRLVNLPTPSDDRIERDVQDELSFHIEMRTRELVRLGHSADDARRQASVELGDAERWKRVLAREDRQARRDRRLARWFADFAFDVRFSLRQLARSPLFAVIAILTVAIGIGANTSIMSAVRGIVLRPLPFNEPENLVRMYSRHPRVGTTAMSVADFADIRAQATSFIGMAAWYETTASLSGDGEPERLDIAAVNDNWFGLLGVRPLKGRTFVAGEDAAGAPVRVVLSEGFWRRRFASDPGIVGRTLRLDGEPVEVIGVVNGDAAFPAGRDVWRTTRFDAEEFTNAQRGARWLRVLGRLSPGASLAQANEELSRISRQLEQDDPRHNLDYTAIATSLQNSIVGSYRRPLFILLGAVGLVMLVVCTNVAGLMVARTAGRETEIAVRTAIGAGRGRIVRQLVTESLVLAITGGALGFGLGIIGTSLLVRAAPAEIPRLEQVSIDAPVFVFSLGLAMAAGVFFGLIPALQASRRDLRSRLQGRGNAGRTGGVRLRRALVISELAVSIVLLVGAGLLLRSFAKLQRVDPGFRTQGLTAFTVTLPSARYGRLDDQRQFLQRALQDLEAIPGVDRVAASFGLPLTETRFQLTFTIDGQDGDPANEPRGQVRVASPGYFESMGIPVLKGRVFTPQDRWETQRVMVVSEELAKRFFPDGDAIGRRIETGWGRDGHQLGGTIVGIVGDVKQFGLSLDAPAAYYAAADQWPTDEITFTLRGGAEQSGMIGAVRAVIERLDPELPIFDVTTGERLLAGSIAQPRFYLLIIAAFALVSLLLAGIGIYGIIAYTVRQRTREIGVRMALGASSNQIVGAIVREGLTLATIGLVIGMSIALALSGQIRDLLFGVSERDWVTLIGVAAVLLLASIAASLVPARAAVRLGPQEALRD